MKGTKTKKEMINAMIGLECAFKKYIQELNIFYFPQQNFRIFYF